MTDKLMVGSSYMETLLRSKLPTNDEESKRNADRMICEGNAVMSGVLEAFISNTKDGDTYSWIASLAGVIAAVDLISHAAKPGGVSSTVKKAGASDFEAYKIKAEVEQMKQEVRDVATVLANSAQLFEENGCAGPGCEACKIRSEYAKTLRENGSKPCDLLGFDGDENIATAKRLLDLFRARFAAQERRAEVARNVPAGGVH